MSRQAIDALQDCQDRNVFVVALGIAALGHGFKGP